MTELRLLADDLNVSERTLRRAANRGTIRTRREGPRRLFVQLGEFEYVQTRWPLIGRMLSELRTLPNVRLAVLYGSVARGMEDPGSDVDVLVRFRQDDVRARAVTGARLEAASGRRVQLVSVDDAPPLLLADVLRDGRVLVDRDDEWTGLTARRSRIERDARVADDALEQQAWAALEELGVVV